jgi:hypothetical protein
MAGFYFNRDQPLGGFDNIIRLTNEIICRRIKRFRDRLPSLTMGISINQPPTGQAGLALQRFGP